LSCLQTCGGEQDNNSDGTTVSTSCSGDERDRRLSAPTAAVRAGNDIDISFSTGASRKDDKTMTSADIHQLLRQLGCLVVDLRDSKKKNLCCGHFVKMLEILKGNSEHLQTMSLEDILEDHLSMFTQQSTSNFVSSQDPTAVETTTSMPRGGPPQPNNHNMKRKMAYNEHMIETGKQTPRCSICFGKKHKANGCHLVSQYNACMVQPRVVEEMVTRLGNPLYYVVNQPDESTTHLIEQFIVPGNSNEIPQDAFHLVLMNTFTVNSVIPNQSCEHTPDALHSGQCAFNLFK
jgi:hypothetical protein